MRLVEEHAVQPARRRERGELAKLFFHSSPHRQASAWLVPFVKNGYWGETWVLQYILHTTSEKKTYFKTCKIALFLGPKKGSFLVQNGPPRFDPSKPRARRQSPQKVSCWALIFFYSMAFSAHVHTHNSVQISFPALRAREPKISQTWQWELFTGGPAIAVEWHMYDIVWQNSNFSF